MRPEPSSRPSRRQVIVAGAGVVSGAVALTACGGSSSGAGGAAAAPSSSTGGSTGKVLAKLSDVAVGSAIPGQDAAGKPIILAQPTAGKVVAFTAICTHMGCTVAPAGGLKLLCPCHGSTYDAATGKNTGGPAPRPLAAIPVTVQGDSIVSE